MIYYDLDPCFVLEPGEVHIKSSHHNLHNQQGNLTDIILGEVLVSLFAHFRVLSHTDFALQLTRHPCKLPTDVQKVCDKPLASQPRLPIAKTRVNRLPQFSRRNS